jgi:hypothetical protein
VDCVVLVQPGRPNDVHAFREMRAGLPFVDLTIVRSAARFDEYVSEIFGTDRLGKPKGVIEVIL